MTFIVGLTGGLGSGKSTVAQLFSEYNIPIIDADKIARDLVAPSGSFFLKIVQRFGPEILLPDGNLNRPLLRQIIFHDASQRKWLESLLHPPIFNGIINEISEIKSQYSYCIVVIPLLAENFSFYQDIIDHVIVVDAPFSIQITRVAKRDNISPIEVEKILQAQAQQAERLKIADTVLSNTGTLLDLKKKVDELHSLFSKTKTSR